MKRRPPPDVLPSVPHKLAIGPHVPTWGDDTDPDVMRAGLGAYLAWSAACRGWVSSHRLDRRQARCLLPRHRTPYWSKPRAIRGAA